jgi:CRP-like cAMP-binding protein
MFCPPDHPATHWDQERARENIAAWEELFGPGSPWHCESGILLFQEGQEPREIFLLTEGLVLLYCDLPDRAESALGLRFPGQVLEQCAHHLHLPYPVSARTLIPSTIYRIAADELRERERQNREISLFFERQLRIDLYNADVFIMELKTSSPVERLDRLLRLLAAGLGCNPKFGVLQVPMPLRDDQLADMLGCSARHLKRIKKQLQQEGRLRTAGRQGLILTTH